MKAKEIIKQSLFIISGYSFIAFIVALTFIDFFNL